MSNLINYLLYLAVTYIPLFHSLKYPDSKRNANHKGIRAWVLSISRWGWLFIISMLLLGGFNYWKEHQSQLQSEKGELKIDSLQIQASNNIKFIRAFRNEFENQTNESQKKDSIENLKTKELIKQKDKTDFDETPILNIATSFKEGVKPLTQLNPLILNLRKDVWATVFKVENIGNGVACNLKDKYVFIGYDSLKNAPFIYDNDYDSYLNSNEKISNKNSLRIMAIHNIKDMSKTSFVAFELSYTDSKNKNQQSLKKVYSILENNTILFDASKEQFRYVEAFLKNKKFWK